MKENNHLLALRDKYGELLELGDIAVIFKYKTIEAVRKAHSRGTLPVSLYRFHKKSGWYAKTTEAANCIENLGDS
jgi:hypothetical protein